MSGNKEGILIIDDDKHLLVTLCDFLSYEGYLVRAASTAEEGLERIAEAAPDLILLDISMPGMGGVAFLNRIADRDGKPRHPVIVFTARSAMREFFGTVAVDAFLEKPCERRELLARVREILDRHRSERPGAAGRLVLLGEDDPELATAISRELVRAGFTVEVVGSGPDVLEKASLIAPDAVALKQVLPRMNGNAVAGLITQMARTRTTPVILYDGNGMLSDRDFRCGASRCLTSDSPALIAAAVRETLPHKPPATPS